MTDMFEKQTKPSLRVRHAERTRREVLDTSCDDQTIRSLTDNAEVVLLPINASPQEGAIFPTDTTELYRGLQFALPTSRVEIAARDEHYCEQLLRHFLIDLGVILLQWVVAPFATAALWDYVKKRTGILSDARMRVRLLISPNNPDEPVLEIEYEGPVADFPRLVPGEVQAQLEATLQLPSASEKGDNDDL